MSNSAVEQMDRAPRSNVVDEDIEPHELVKETSNGLELLDGSESRDDWEGIALQPESGMWAHDHEEDTSDLVYQSSEDDRASYGGREDAAVIRPMTVDETTDGVTSSPSISEGDIVGVPDTTANDGPGSAGRIVEEGYTNDENDDSSTTTFNRSNNNFIPIGIAREQDDVSDYGAQVRVEVRGDL